MKLLYIVPRVTNAGGVARVLSLKMDYFIENFGYEVHVLSQNEENLTPFYSFNSKIIFHNMKLEGNVFHFFFSFQKSVSQKLRTINPDVVLVADNGLKAFTYPFIFNIKIPIVFEYHGSKFVEIKHLNKNFIQQIKNNLEYAIKDFCANNFSKFIALSNESLNEWKVKNGMVISNPSWLKSEKQSDLKSKKVIAVARNSYEKGIDRLLSVWEKVVVKYPDWTLDVYGESVIDLEPIIRNFGIEAKVTLNNPVKNITEKYLSSSICVMTSRSEGFGMVLLEAMSCGLPCVAYDCPVGPRGIIDDGKNGFLVEDGNIDFFIEKLERLIQDEDLRNQMGRNAKESFEKYDIKPIMQQWKILFESLVNQ